MSPLRRVLALLLSLWFTVYVGEPELLLPCPTHDSMTLPRGEVAGMHAAAHATAHEGAHGASRHSAGGSHGRDAAPESAHQCHCPGPCSGASGAVMASSPRLPVGTTLVARLERVAPTHEHTPVEPAHTLPFANGPPAAAHVARTASLATTLPI